MLSDVVQFTLALEILLVCGEGTIPALTKRLPLGGTHLAQLGLVLGLAVAVVDFWQSYAHLVIGVGTGLTR